VICVFCAEDEFVLQTQQFFIPAQITLMREVVNVLPAGMPLSSTPVVRFASRAIVAGCTGCAGRNIELPDLP
jgi:hypothetical protein